MAVVLPTRGDLRSKASAVSLTLPLKRLSKGSALDNDAMAVIQSFMIPKSCGSLVASSIAKYQMHMGALQDSRGYSDAEMKIRFKSNKAMLHTPLRDNEGASGYLRYQEQCFNVVDPHLSIRLDDGLRPVEFRVHRKLGHRLMMLQDTGDIVCGTDLDGNDLPPHYSLTAIDVARGFNDDMHAGFERAEKAEKKD